MFSAIWSSADPRSLPAVLPPSSSSSQLRGQVRDRWEGPPTSRTHFARKLFLHPLSPEHTQQRRVFSGLRGWDLGVLHTRINNLISKCIFCLHYATVKVLIYNLQHINHPSNFQMLNASLTFMFSSITWLFWGRGAVSCLLNPSPVDGSEAVKGSLGLHLYCGQEKVLFPTDCVAAWPKGRLVIRNCN